jgi:hypothetical protein
MLTKQIERELIDPVGLQDLALFRVTIATIKANLLRSRDAKL